MPAEVNVFGEPAMSNEEILDQNQQDSQDEVQPETAAEVNEDILQSVDETEGEAFSPEELIDRLEQAEKKATENWDQLLRTKAEMDNIRRRTQKDLENAHKFALEKFITELLSVKDSLKKEKIWRYIFKTREEARAEVFDYIEVFYNRARRHQHLGNISPEAYEEQMAKFG